MNIQLVFCEANIVADFMASKGCDVHLGVCFYVVPPLVLGSFLRHNIVRLPFQGLLFSLFCFVLSV